jgi:hypothetical protein
MRFIIRELTYEKPLAAGQLRYESNGRPTGTVEKWRLTAAVSGYRFLRVDLDARDAPSGHTYLYHLVLTDQGRPERLSYRFWGADMQVSGNVLLEDEILTSTRDVNGHRYEDLVLFQPSCGFWFPSSVGLGLLANCAQGGDPPEDDVAQAVTLTAMIGDELPSTEHAFTLQRTEVRLTLGTEETLQMMGRQVKVKPFTIRWDDQHRVIWLDEHNWPLKMRRGDGLTAIETRYVRYN